MDIKKLEEELKNDAACIVDFEGAYSQEPLLSTQYALNGVAHTSFGFLFKEYEVDELKNR